MNIRLLKTFLVNSLVAIGLSQTAQAANNDARPHASDDKGLTIVELFTSQGCSSCPPADKYLTELAARPGILALSWFVDYWNYLGWKDTFGREEHTNRQKGYNHSLGELGVYTPQMIVNGVAQGVGSHRQAIEASIAVQQHQHPVHIPVSIEYGKHKITAAVGKHGTNRPADVWFICFKSKAEVAIRSGELKDKTMNYTNVVTYSQKVGQWNGKIKTYSVHTKPVNETGADSCAIIVQYDGTGPIIGAARTMMHH